MDNKQKGNLAIASAIKHFVSIGYTVSMFFQVLAIIAALQRNL